MLIITKVSQFLFFEHIRQDAAHDCIPILKLQGDNET